MILISHRGNVSGRIPEVENSLEYVDAALSIGYDVEIDVRMIDGVLFLGHDEPQYGTTQDWLNKRSDKLWIHCKNIEAIEWFNGIYGFNYFWHDTDTVTLTSKGFVWTYPGKQPIKRSIAVLPEMYNEDVSNCVGVCSDYIQNYKS